MKKHLLLVLSTLLLLVLALCGCTAPEVTGIEVNAENAKYWYVSGAELDTSGLVVTATMSDGSTRTVPVEECELQKPAFAPVGEKEVVVIYQGCEARYPIFACTAKSETEQRTTYAIRTNENGSAVTLTAYVAHEGAPFVLIFPGGGYAAVYMQQEGYEYAEEISRLGYNAFILQYSVNMQHPAPLDDVNTAYEIIRDNRDFFGVSMENYAVCGSSAGGHLAATWSTKSVGYEHYGKPKPAAVILAYASTHIGEGSRSNLLGEHPTEEIRASLSADLQADGDYPAVYGWVFVEDELVCQQTRQMEAALEAQGVKHLYRYFTGGAHGLGLAKGTEAEGWMEEAVGLWQDAANLAGG